MFICAVVMFVLLFGSVSAVACAVPDSCSVVLTVRAALFVLFCLLLFVVVCCAVFFLICCLSLPPFVSY